MSVGATVTGNLCEHTHYAESTPGAKNTSILAFEELYHLYQYGV